MIKLRKEQETESDFIKKIKKEHARFKFEKLSCSKHDLYDECNEIRCFECLYEYFLYCENIPEEFLSYVKDKEYVLTELYIFFLEDEFTNVDSWEHIEEMLELYMQREMVLQGEMA